MAPQPGTRVIISIFSHFAAEVHDSLVESNDDTVARVSRRADIAAATDRDVA
jgi:hypothetical protein